MRMIVAVLCLAAAAGAADEPAKRSLNFQTGKVTVGADLAHIDLPDGYRYLQTADARYVVEQVMHNPPDPEIVGLILPKGAEDAAEGSGDSGWVAVVSYSDRDGHVKDEDAKTADYDQLLEDMQANAREQAPELRKQGYSGYELLAWAEPPHYDATAHKLYWAQQAKFDGAAEPTLNYNVRILGRRGVLVINAIDSIEALPRVAEGAKLVQARTEFTAGNRYEDFKPGYDKVAAYGIGGLIAGGILAKAGFFAVIGKFLLAAIKPIIFGLVLLGGVAAKLFGGRNKKDTAAQS
jgi:uncharacterized membrane-anchored protein